MLTADQREQVTTELKHFAADLKLTDEQKEKTSNRLDGSAGKGRRIS